MDEILNLIEPVSEGFPSYSCVTYISCPCHTFLWMCVILGLKDWDDIVGDLILIVSQYDPT